MPQFFFNKRLILLLVGIIILVALIGFSLRDRNRLSWPEQFVKDTTGFIQTGFHKPVQMVSSFFEDIQDLKNTYNENQLLKGRLEGYVLLETQIQELKKENTELRDILGAKESLRAYDPIPATVVSRNPDKWQEIFTINKGEQDGVSKNMPVVTKQGLIGKIKSSSQFYSTVQLLTADDKTNRVSAKIAGLSNVYGLIEGYDQERKELLLKAVPIKVTVSNGTKILTSGLGDVFPEGLLIGEVSEVILDEFGLTKTVYVKPAADFYTIDEVIVARKKMVQKNQGEDNKS